MDWFLRFSSATFSCWPRPCGKHRKNSFFSRRGAWPSCLPSSLRSGGLLLLGLAGIRLPSGSVGWVPCLLLALFPTASLTLLLHSATAVEPPPRPWLLARSFGFSPFTAFHRALFSPVAVPWITAWTTQLSQAVFTAMVLEMVLTIDGGGNLFANAVQQRDLPVLQAVLLLNGAVFLLLQSGTSWLATILDPRQRKLGSPAKPV